MVKRILLLLEYDGTRYSGWQRQFNAISVQQALEEALLKATGSPVKVTGASRTDAGVHAKAQGAHFDTASSIPPDKFPFVLNTLLPPDIRVHFGMEVPMGFHARFQAQGKLYTYRVYNSRHASAILRHTHAHVPLPLDWELMDRAAQALVGTHDFAAFAAAGGSAKTTVRFIHEIHVAKSGPEVLLTVRGNAFLYHMVRIIAGTLIEIGCRKLSPDCFSRALATGDRLCLGATAPACGLELTRVFYRELKGMAKENADW